MKLLIVKYNGEYWLNAKQIAELATASPTFSVFALIRAIREAMRK